MLVAVHKFYSCFVCCLCAIVSFPLCHVILPFPGYTRLIFIVNILPKTFRVVAGEP